MINKPNGFLQRHPEKAEHNQYWYSAHTIGKIVEELTASATRIACLSTPSIYFSLPRGSQLRSDAWLFDLDEQWASDPHFVRYDFNVPEDIPTQLLGAFDCVVIDPPFITREVWDKYAQAAKLLLQSGGKVLATTVAENAAMLAELLPDVRPTPFRPSIPHLIYQYNLFTNFPPAVLCHPNPEIPPDD
ncbi:hypothetical protein VOLCADRAFT_103866 [Volvox carteri f. nagariensis]|uniref:N6-adenine methyltransferase n=1 Tax=Volvox carteri f. nagariensis TaxID=3068 RepID=D8TPR1_VOLCA|nr:uncharacterized protein VOLCADRAFT_103866 [Volvox carteri f. nagariensis]EFJ50810.1 hypothetical protein VOLCADRAFT_103866 [Volvox carteri f. nagariensis]|eukprot:XP_002948403.1 hypothetical protein VOLCADRAFT_103866 [Volvox carteri f. nagariensis]